MKQIFEQGDQKIFRTEVTENKLAEFDTGMVHPVYSTFALAKDAEWACRLFVLEMKEQNEEGIGTHISIDHIAPALQGSEIEIRATVDHIKGNEILCTFEVHSGERLLARGSQGQKVILKEKLNHILKSIKNK